MEDLIRILDLQRLADKSKKAATEDNGPAVCKKPGPSIECCDAKRVWRV